jgi:adenylate kinase family enzyme
MLASRRIWIKGGSGSGKTTLAKELARRLDLEHVELDALHHDANCTAAPAQLLQERVRCALDDVRGWVVDGNYDSKLGTLVLDRAELIVWLDLGVFSFCVQKVPVQEALKAADSVCNLWISGAFLPGLLSRMVHSPAGEARCKAGTAPISDCARFRVN